MRRTARVVGRSDASRHRCLCILGGGGGGGGGGEKGGGLEVWNGEGGGGGIPVDREGGRKAHLHISIFGRAMPLSGP